MVFVIIIVIAQTREFIQFYNNLFHVSRQENYKLYHVDNREASFEVNIRLPLRIVGDII